MRTIHRRYRVVMSETTERVCEVSARSGAEAKAIAVDDGGESVSLSEVKRQVKGRPRLACTTPAERLAEHVDRRGPDECWPWTGTITTNGYGQFSFEHRSYPAHRSVYEAAHGPIGDGLVVMHRCDNPPCCNLAHLSLGTPGDNQTDKAAKGRSARGEANGGGGKLTEADVVAIRHRSNEGESNRQIAVAFGVSAVMVGLIVRRRQWAHVA